MHASTQRLAAVLGFASAILVASQARPDEPSRDEVLAGMKKAASYYRQKVALRGGYVYYYSLDLKQRLGEGVATVDQIWVQPPGTPTVGMAYLAAYRGTGDRFYLDAATEAAQALVAGQLKSGGWTHAIDFDPKGKRAAAYRKGNTKGKANSTLDDNTSQSALTFLMRVDEAHGFKNEEIHEASKFGLDALLKAQFPNGGFPQVWTGPVEARAVAKAAYPDYEWRSENRIKEYWTQYTLNDGLAGDVADTLIAAHEVYKEKRAHDALRKLGDFLVLAQMPDPQPAWAQQYDAGMRPIWARKFEPPAITGNESQDAMEALMTIYRQTRDERYLEPIPRAIAYLRKSLLPDGRLARFYELKTNKPLYMTANYQLTYDDGDVPTHYGWKVSSKLDRIEKDYEALKNGKDTSKPTSAAKSRPSASQAKKVETILGELDAEGRWISGGSKERLAGQPKFKDGDRYLSSEVFSRNLTTLSDYAAATR